MIETNGERESRRSVQAAQTWWWWCIIRVSSLRVSRVTYVGNKIMKNNCPLHRHLTINFIPGNCKLYKKFCDDRDFKRFYNSILNFYKILIFSLHLSIYIYIYITIIIIMSRCQHEYLWPSFTTHPHRLSLSGSFQGYILYRHRAVVYRF